MQIHDPAAFGLYGNVAVCPSCRDTIPDEWWCEFIPTIEGPTAYCRACVATFWMMERQLKEET